MLPLVSSVPFISRHGINSCFIEGAFRFKTFFTLPVIKGLKILKLIADIPKPVKCALYAEAWELTIRS